MSKAHGRNGRYLGLLAALSLMATAACGSTVQQTGQDALAGGGQVLEGSLSAPGTDGLAPGDGFSPASPEAGAAGGQPLSGPGSSGTVGSGGSTASSGATSGSTGSAPGSTGGTGSAAGNASVAHGPGVTPTSIFLGIPYCSDCSSANAALGAGGED